MDNRRGRPRQRKQAREYRIEICRFCRRDWAVSKLAEVPDEGYVCPDCAQRIRPRAAASSSNTYRGRSYWNVCEKCGSFLDPGEKCDCEVRKHA